MLILFSDTTVVDQRGRSRLDRETYGTTETAAPQTNNEERMSSKVDASLEEKPDCNLNVPCKNVQLNSGKNNCVILYLVYLSFTLLCTRAEDPVGSNTGKNGSGSDRLSFK